MNKTRPLIRFTSLLVITLFVVSIAVSASAAHAADPGASADQEKTLLAILNSDAAAAEKAVACKKLAIFGSDNAVASLAELLPDPRLSSWSRIALEAIPGQVADKALRDATESLDGGLLIGTINSIGVRRDEQAVPLLIARLQDADTQVAAAAAVALGRIGNKAATIALRQALNSTAGEVRDAVAQGCVLSAERSLANGSSDEAAEIYDEIRSADVPEQRIVEATRGAILARKQDGIPLLLETVRSPEKQLFQLALSTVREFPGGQIDKALAEEISQAPPQRAALIIQAMADRPDTVVLEAILQAARQGDPSVQLSAIDALRRVGNVSCMASLMKLAVGTNADLASAAKATLAEIQDDGINDQIVASLPEAQGASYPLLLELIGQRRIDAVPELVTALDHRERTVRHAALVSLGETVSLQKLSLLLSEVVEPKHAEDAEVAAGALRSASVRMPDREACAGQLADALQRSSADTKTTLLEILSEVGGSSALKTLAASAMSDDDRLQDTGSRLLGTWNSVDAAPVLLDLAKHAPADKYRVRSLRGYIGLARKFFHARKTASTDVSTGIGNLAANRRTKIGVGGIETSSQCRRVEDSNCGKAETWNPRGSHGRDPSDRAEAATQGN